MECLPSSLCQTCVKEQPPVHISEPESSLGPPVQYSENDGSSDISCGSVKESEEGFVCGNFAWAKHRIKWYPAKVVSKADISANLQKTLFRTIGNIVVVKWYGAEKYSKLKTVNVDGLSDNKVDAARLPQSHQMQILHQQALADLRLD